MTLEEHPYIYCPGTKICTCPTIPTKDWGLKKQHKCSIKVFPPMKSMERILQRKGSKRTNDRKVKVRIFIHGHRESGLMTWPK